MKKLAAILTLSFLPGCAGLGIGDVALGTLTVKRAVELGEAYLDCAANRPDRAEFEAVLDQLLVALAELEETGSTSADVLLFATDQLALMAVACDPSLAPRAAELELLVRRMAERIAGG